MKRPDGSPEPAWASGRKFQAQDLQLMLLALLARGPAHGYALTHQLATLSHGFYHPSPGVMYPALAALYQLGLVHAEDTRGRKSYSLSDAGRARLEAEADRAGMLFGRLEHAARKMAWMQRVWRGEPITPGTEGEDRASGFLPDYVAARVAFKRALLRHAQATPAQQRDIAAVLRRASAELNAIPAEPTTPALAAVAPRNDP